MMKFGLFATAVCLFLIECTPIPVNPPPQPDADAAPAPAFDAGTDGGRCAAAYQHAAAELHCALRVPETGSWTDACINSEANAVNMHTKCIIQAANCEAVSLCLDR